MVDNDPRVGRKAERTAGHLQVSVQYQDVAQVQLAQTRMSDISDNNNQRPTGTYLCVYTVWTKITTEKWSFKK